MLYPTDNSQSCQWTDVLMEQQGSSVIMTLPDPRAGSLRHYPLAPGIYLSYIHIHTDMWPVPPQGASDHVLLINYCRSGRCEVLLNNERYAYLSGRQLALSLQQMAAPCRYPGRGYEGLEIFLDLEILQRDPYPLFRELGIDPAGLCGRYRLTENFRILTDTGCLTDTLQRLWELDRTEQISRMKLLLADLLLGLPDQPDPAREAVQYFTPAQVQIVRDVCALINEDLSAKHSAKGLALRYGISEASLKTYFRGICGDSISAYMRRLRMQQAAQLLECTQLKIFDIAQQTGYDNQSKFSAAFRREYGVSPLEYRRMKRLEQNAPGGMEMVKHR